MSSGEFGGKREDRAELYPFSFQFVDTMDKDSANQKPNRLRWNDSTFCHINNSKILNFSIAIHIRILCALLFPSSISFCFSHSFCLHWMRLLLLRSSDSNYQCVLFFYSLHALEIFCWLVGMYEWEKSPKLCLNGRRSYEAQALFVAAKSALLKFFAMESGWGEEFKQYQHMCTHTLPWERTQANLFNHPHSWQLITFFKLSLRISISIHLQCKRHFNAADVVCWIWHFDFWLCHVQCWQRKNLKCWNVGFCCWFGLCLQITQHNSLRILHERHKFLQTNQP